MRSRSRAFKGLLWAGLLALLLIGAGRLALSLVGWWIDLNEPAVRSDIIVVLAGSYTRPILAAELYGRGYAPEVWLSRPAAHADRAALQELGFRMTSEESTVQRILLKKGVPADRIRLYGRDVLSTADEAAALAEEFPHHGKKILVVTSRFHARRARMTFRRFLPGADIHVVSPTREASARPWWKDKGQAPDAILEVFKTFYFILGGRMKRDNAQ